MNSIKSLRVPGFVLITLILLVGCQSIPRRKGVDRSILTNVPCAAPCWQGIIPGQTTADEAFEILTKLGYKPHRGEWGSYIGWYSPAGYPKKVLKRGANSLDSLQIAGPIAYLKIGLEFDLSAKGMLDKYGLPERYQVYETMGTLLEGGHTPIVVVLFYYVQQGLIFEAWIPVSVPPGETVTMGSNMTLDWIYYLPPTSIEHLMRDNPRLGRVIPEGEPLQNWQGFPIEFQRAK